MVDWGSVPEWFGGVSLVLAFVIFAFDRQNQARGQVEQVGVWYEELHVTGETALKITAQIVARNASLLPVTLSSVTYTLGAVWLGEGGGSGTGPTREFGPFRDTTYPHPRTLPGGGERRWPVEHLLAVEHPFEAEAAGAQIVPHCHVEEVVVIDNAGRRWVVTGQGRPGRHRNPIRVITRIVGVTPRSGRHLPKN